MKPIIHVDQVTKAYGGAKGREPEFVVPKKWRPFATYPFTGTPKSAESSVGIEGPSDDESSEGIQKGS